LKYKLLHDYFPDNPAKPKKPIVEENATKNFISTFSVQYIIFCVLVETGCVCTPVDLKALAMT